MTVSDQIQTEMWILHELMRLGMNRYQAEVAIDFRLSHHDFEPLLKRGCDLELAFEILKPLDAS